MSETTSAQTFKANSQLKQVFSEQEIEALWEYIETEHIAEGSTFMRKDEPADSMAFVIQGLVQVIDGDQQIALLKDGEFLGESLFSDHAARNADVQAIEDTIVGIFTLDDFQDFLNKDQTTALKFHKHFKAVGQAREAESFAEKYRDKRKFLALVAHNNMKSSLMEFCKMQSENLEQFPLIATGTTGSLLYKETGLILARKVASGPLGGDQAVGTLISTNNICGVIFFRDPLSAHPHHADIEALGRLCDVYQIPFATNPQSGEAILDYLLSGKAEQQTISNQVLETYQRGQSQVITQHLDNSHPS